MNYFPAAEATVDRTPATTYDVVGTGPFAVVRDGDHGVFRIVNADGTPAAVTTTVAAEAGFQAAVTETTSMTFATLEAAEAVADAANA